MLGCVDGRRKQPEDARIAEPEPEVRQFSLTERQPHGSDRAVRGEVHRVAAQPPGQPPELAQHARARAAVGPPADQADDPPRAPYLVAAAPISGGPAGTPGRCPAARPVPRRAPTDPA